MNWLSLAMLGLLALVSLAVVFVGLRKRRLRLSGPAKRRLSDQWQHALSIEDPARRVLEADKVLDHTLKELGYEGNVTDKLKKYQQRFGSVESVWQAHKLRNRIAHEPGVSLSDREADRAVNAFGKLINLYIR